MQNIKYLLVLFLMVMFGCKKEQKQDPASNYDVVNGTFRVIVSTDADYNLTILEINPKGANGSDTIRHLQATGGSAFNFGFTPLDGNIVVFKAVSLNGKTLDCTLGYKGTRLGIDNLDTSNNRLTATYTYTVNDDDR